MKAAVAGQQLQGSFASGGEWYKFTASRQDDTLLLTSEGATYTMKRQPTPNPLGIVGNQGPDKAVGPADVPKGYTLVKASAAGKSMTVEKAGPINVRDALNAVMDDLDDFFDDDWDVNGSFEEGVGDGTGVGEGACKILCRKVLHHNSVPVPCLGQGENSA